MFYYCKFINARNNRTLKIQTRVTVPIDLFTYIGVEKLFTLIRWADSGGDSSLFVAQPPVGCRLFPENNSTFIKLEK